MAEKNLSCPVLGRDGIEKQSSFITPKEQYLGNNTGRMMGISYYGNHTCFRGYAVQVLEPSWITSGQIEAGQKAMTRHARVCIFFDKFVTVKPTMHWS